MDTTTNDALASKSYLLPVSHEVFALSVLFWICSTRHHVTKVFLKILIMATCAIVSAFLSLAPQAVYGYSVLDSGWYPTVGCRTSGHKCAFFSIPAT
jgi:hypothetical protein